MIHLKKRTAFTDALIVLSREVAHDFWFFHLNTEVGFYKINGRKDGQK